MEQEEQPQENGFEEVAATGGPTARINSQNQPIALHFLMQALYKYHPLFPHYREQYCSLAFVTPRSHNVSIR